MRLRRPPFVTGSRAYGITREGSDLDLVLFVDLDTQQELIALLHVDSKGQRTMDYDDLSGTTSLRAGALNLLLCTDKQAYDVWRDGTDKLVSESPVDRERAVEVFRELRGKRLAPKTSA